MAKIFIFLKTCFLASASKWANGFQRTVKAVMTTPSAPSWAATASYEYIKYYIQSVPTLSVKL